MRHIRLVSTPRFERSTSIKFLVRHPILDIGCTFNSFISKLWWQSIRLHHTSSHLLEASILPLNNTSLLSCVRNRVLHLDTCIFTIFNEIKLYIFTTIIISKDIDFPPRLVLNQGLENLQVLRNFRLEFKEVNPIEPIKFIYESKDILAWIMDI